MKKFVYLLYGDGYEECIKNALEQNAQAYVFQPFKYELIRKLHILHNARPLNEKKELPFKTIWFKRALKGMRLEKNDEVYFLLYESFHLSYSRGFLQYLRRNFPKAKICFMYWNPVIELIRGKVQKISDCLDAVITFNEKDAKQYGYQFCPNFPYKLPVYKDKSIPESDVFFIGADKGRLNKLIAIYEKLTNAGLKCDFHIVGVPEEKQKYRNEIIYNKMISYSEVLARVYAAKCVLEVLQGNEDYVSIRTFEALQYHRKLLTESKSSKKLEFYSPKIIQIFDTPECINTDFVREEVADSEYSDGCLGNAQAFHNYLLTYI